MAEKSSPREPGDDSPAEGVASLCCTTCTKGFARMTKGLSLGPRGRIKRNLAEDKWECPDIPMVMSNDKVDNRSWLNGIEAYAWMRTTQEMQCRTYAS
jgi:hypothetical protein